MTPITLDIVEAYSLCPRKAFLLLVREPLGVQHDYVRIIEEQEAANRQAYRTITARAADAADGRSLADLMPGHDVILDVSVVADDLEAHCDALRRGKAIADQQECHYEPVKILGTQRGTKSQVLGLAYVGLVLGEVQDRQPSSGTLVLLGGRPSKVNQPVGDAPSVVLNKHCPICPFREACLQRAEREDNLSLLDRMTPKLMRKYHDKGIFTVRQLSHIYKSRRSRKKAKRQVRHSLELQALAIRTGKVYVDHLPELPRGPVELFLDIEGVPDRDSHYLAGLLVCRSGEAVYESFWADDATGEATMWSALIERLTAFPYSPVYHYGSYEKKAFSTLAKRHGGSCAKLRDRFVNVASSVYGKVYFPVRSNGLKSLGQYLGAAWTDPQASGMQSLVWRHRWEMTRDERFRQSLLQYNREDCEAVRLLVDRLDQIRRDVVSDPAVEFASRPKRHTTETGKAVHRQFARILRNAEEDGQQKSVRDRAVGPAAEGEPKKRGARVGHQTFRHIAPKTSRTVVVEPRQRCPKDDTAPVRLANARWNQREIRQKSGGLIHRCDSTTAMTAVRIAAGKPAQAAITRCKPVSCDANLSHSGRQKCMPCAARHSWQITQPQDRISVASEWGAGSIPTAHSRQLEATHATNRYS